MLIEKQMKYFSYHQFPFFTCLPALIISEEPDQTSNRFPKWWFGRYEIPWADHLLRAGLLELSTHRGDPSSPARPAPWDKQTGRGVEETAKGTESSVMYRTTLTFLD